MQDLDIEYRYSILQASKNKWAIISTPHLETAKNEVWQVISKHESYGKAVENKNELERWQDIMLAKKQ